jgi:predicted DCC family thiol-disulfide oxidoreductase YuxK
VKTTCSEILFTQQQPKSTMNPTHPIIFFDGVCNLCDFAVTFVIDHDPVRRFRFAALQSQAGQQLMAQYPNIVGQDTVLLFENGVVYGRSDAALRIARHLHGWRWLWALRVVPRHLRDAIYKLIARNRYWLFGKRDACRIPTPELRNLFLA